MNGRLGEVSGYWTAFRIAQRYMIHAFGPPVDDGRKKARQEGNDLQDAQRTSAD